ncbi:MAG TPA: alpha/beta family hydrolase [Ktedonobacteraceae bacterium]|jgi:putative phosphoribosyl transferase|nr:alpha/beta family hydrolase [Ktedonobacteraceae bacterium]
MENLSHETTQPCQISISETVTLEGLLTLPEHARAIVLFAHGSGSSRHSPRNQFVARVLQQTGLATLLFDLLTLQEEEQERITAHLRFDISLLSKRVVKATNWLMTTPATSPLKIGYFGASTGAAAALVAAAELPHLVGAIVSRGGRPDLAGDALSRVWTPTLLLVGARDSQVIELNRRACSLLKGEKRLELVSGATHLFEEPGTLEQVALHAQRWFIRYLRETPENPA